jgi:D-alanyl-D-alanine carboxypeptidase
MPGVFAEGRDGDQVWRGAAGVADVSTGGPVTPDMQHRVGSISKAFTAAAVLQQVESGQIVLDTPIGYYLPHLVPGERGQTITVRMLINHTSGWRNTFRVRTRPLGRSHRWRTPRPRA